MEVATDTAVETAPETVSEVAATDAAVESSDTTDSQDEASFYYDADTPAIGDVPDWFKSSKYKTISDQAAAYVGLESKLGGFIGAPESGEYEITPIEGVDQAAIEALVASDVFNDLQELGIKNGMSNEFMNEFTNTFAMSQQKEQQAFIDAELTALGDNAKARIDNVNNKLGVILEGDLLEAVQSSLSTAKAIEGIEAILDRNTNTVAPADVVAPSADQEAELNNLWVATDDRGRRKMEYDAPYRDMVNKKFKEFYGD